MTFLTVDENLKFGEIVSRLSFQRFIEFGYFAVHFAATRSNASNAFFRLQHDILFLNQLQTPFCLYQVHI